MRKKEEEEKIPTQTMKIYRRRNKKEKNAITHHYTQTVRARGLTFFENVHPPPSVTCQLSCDTCHMSRVTRQVSHGRCHMSGVMFRCHASHIYIILQSGLAICLRVCYQRGLTCLVIRHTRDKRNS